MSGKHADWDKIEETYLAMKEQEFEQVDMPDLWSRIEEKLDQNQDREEGQRKESDTDNRERESRKDFGRNRHCENMQQYEEKENGQKNGKGHTAAGKKVAVFGTLAAAVLCVLVSYSVMRSGVSKNMNSEHMPDTWENTDDESSQSSSEELAGGEKMDGTETGKQQQLESDISAAEDSVTNDNINYEEDMSEDKEDQTEIGMDKSEGAKKETKEATNLLYVEKEDGFYEFSVNLEKYRLQLVEINVKNEENIVKVAYSDFSSSVQKKLQAEIADISAYSFYVDSEGVLYMEREAHYYQIHLEKKGDGSDGK